MFNNAVILHGIVLAVPVHLPPGGVGEAPGSELEWRRQFWLAAARSPPQYDCLETLI